MTRLKKVLTLNICILLSLFVMLVFTSCGEKSESDNNTESTTINTSTSDTKPEVTKYKVTFDSNGGNEVEPQFVELNKRINEPEIPIRLGYTFDGWYAGSEKWVFLQHTVVDDITLKAKWTPNENTLTFDANGATGTMSNMTIATDSVVSLTPNSFVKDGYTFVGWSTNVDGEVEYTDGASYTMGAEESYTLYAVWETIIKYTICYEKNGGIENNENPTTFTIDDLPITLNDLDNKTDYLFDFWYKESDFSGTPVTQITDAENIKLYASYINGTDGLVFSQDGEAWRITGYNGTATNVVIPNTYKNREVISIDALAFFDCTGITSIEIPDSVTSIGDNAFFDCTGITSIEIPDSVTSIGDNAFYNCTELTSVNYLGTIEQWCNISFSIYSSNPLCNGANLYVNGEEINNLVIPNTVTEIKDSAFLGCKSLISATIPDSVTSIGDNAFKNCTSLTNVTIPDSVTSIGSSFTGCVNLTNITIPDSVINIDYFAFEGCTGLTSIEIPDSVTSISHYAFANCTGLTSVTIPDSVTSIGDYAFFNCTGLISIEIPDSVITIEHGAFYVCTALTIYCEATSKPSGWDSYWNSSNCPVVWGYMEEENAF